MDDHDSEQERRKFAELYAGMADGELESIVGEADSLSDAAWEALQAEMEKRGMAPHSIAIGSRDVAEWDDLVMLRQFRDLHEALLARGSLDSAGIESFLVDDNMVRMDWFISNLLGGIKLCVREKDAELALDVLEESIPTAFEVEGIGTYKQPRCPACQSLNISYESLNKPVAYTSAWVGLPIPPPA